MKRIHSAVGLALALGALGASSAQASTVTVGQVFPPNGCNADHTFLQTGVSSGASYTIPTSGLITSWSFQDASPTVTGLKLKIARGSAPNYTIVAESSAGAQTANAVNTYQVAIPVQAGDIIGIFAGAAGPCWSTTATTSADTQSVFTADALPGTTIAYTPFIGQKSPVSVSLVPPPGIVLIDPGSGSVSGGTRVTIAGHDFTGTSAVSFGGVPATSFTVDSDHQITAISPKASAPGAVDLHVTSAAGTSSTVAADTFTYSGCRVPKLAGKSLKAAKKALSRADCRLGKVKGPGDGRVKKQKPAPGAVLPEGGKVKVKLG